MNVFLLIEDGVPSCVVAEHMHQAVKLGEAAYLLEASEEQYEGTLREHQEYYTRCILQSCELVAELKSAKGLRPEG